MKKSWLLPLACTVLLGACSMPVQHGSVDASGNWKPDRSIEFIAPAAAGGGWDTTARMLSKTIDENNLANQSFGVVNKPGGGGAVAWAYIHKRNDPHNIFIGSPPLHFVELAGQSQYGYKDFTPIANLIADYGAFAVRDDAKWDTLDELFADMREDPSQVTTIGVSSPGSMDHMQFILFAQAAGVDITKIRYVSDQDGGAMTSVLNGSVDIVSTGVSEAAEQARAGKMKILGITAPERLEGDYLSTLPTAIEQGIDAEFVVWRGVFGPPDMTDEQLAYYEDVFKQASLSDSFAEVREAYGWDELYMGHEEFTEFLDEQSVDLQAALDELGFGG
ncbi:MULTISPECIES: tripartite tricarboxylate transporter substrate binding protein [Shouchella]|uniref:Tripartite tricarboxylate transporter substrate binding protein n=2 Tax=Shouchella TaxID=2893057 RepID=A0ABY7WBF5_9BACI|nr:MULTISPECIES: tripartite tricarboxylate transporter substrate binding protein [Shouchella]MED4128184.1 tripartite tricarboxylate transporter substrate binding protein [Shouchella miscanthi]WDF04964.1 tripartite tricarboxylate transporter substrate binding protein [Shouchella hunanensis]